MSGPGESVPNPPTPSKPVTDAQLGIIDYECMRAMPTQERREKLQAAFAFMRKDGCGLTLSQEQAILAAMEVK